MRDRERNSVRGSHPVRRGAVGVIADGEKYLVVRRAAGIPRGGCWCFPGGHLETGETARRAIQRELAEELGLQVIPWKRLGAVRLTETRYVLAVWQVRPVAGTITPRTEEIAEVRWATPGEILHLHPGLPSNARVLAMLDRSSSARTSI
jgi:8-oxo-dGTP diphosphatase